MKVVPQIIDEEYITERKVLSDGRRLVRTSASAWSKAEAWVESHPWDNRYWLRYGSQRNTSDPVVFTNKVVKWINNTTSVKSEPGSFRGVKTPIIAMVVIGLEDGGNERIHCHGVILSAEPLKTKAIRKRYGLGHSSLRKYDTRENGVRYALDHHWLLQDVGAFQVKRSVGKYSDEELSRLTLQARLRN
jgi:hypothetical protein